MNNPTLTIKLWDNVDTLGAGTTPPGEGHYYIVKVDGTHIEISKELYESLLTSTVK